MKEAISLNVPGVCGMGLHFELDGFRLIYLAIAVLMWSVSGIFSLEYMAHYKKRSRYYLFFWATFFATAGVFLSADFYTTFIFFEIMSFTSYVWVAFDEKKESLRAAQTYLAVAIIGGMVMLMGMFLLYDLCGTLRFDELEGMAGQILKGRRRLQLYAAGGLLLFGFGAKAGCFPLHIWLPKAHPVAPAPASALLSGILTKTGIFGIIAVSLMMFGTDGEWGMLIAGLGLITMLLGALLALFSVNLKRTLACSSVSQIGFILTGIGMSCLLQAAGEDNGLAVRGTFLHMVNHSLFKLVLFLCAAAVYMNLHELDLNKIRGFGRKKPVLMFCFSMGALGISGMPLWSGYISKTLLHESIVEYTQVLEGMKLAGESMPGIGGNPVFWHGAEWLFLISGGMTAAYMLKLWIALFAEPDPDFQAEMDGENRSAESILQTFSGYEAHKDCVKPDAHTSSMKWDFYPKCMRKTSAAALIMAAVLLPLFGLFPHSFMDGMADMAQGFFGKSRHAHLVSYFSAGNLKGGAISLGIGIVLYGVVVRRWMRKDGQYVDRWPSWLDLENLLYRPVLQVALPGICGAVCGFVDRYLVSSAVTVFLAASAVVCRGMDQMADGVIRAARFSTHSQIPRAAAFGTNTEGRGTGGPGSCVRERRARFFSVLARLREQVQRNGRLVEESFSFGLMLFAIGLCLTLGYLLLVFWLQLG